MAEESKETATETISTEVVNALAESINKPFNPLGGTAHKTFVAEPFFKPEVPEEKKTEEEAEKKEGEENKEGAITKPEAGGGTEKKTEEEKLKEEEVEQIPETEFVRLLNETISDPDSSFGSIEDIKTLIAENKQFKENQNQLAGLTQEERARIEIGREFGDFGLYDRVSAIDTTKLSPKEALKQVFFLDNIGKPVQLLEKQFEKQYTKTYEEDPDEDYSKMLLESNGQEAMQTITELQKDLKQRGQISGAANSEEAKKVKEEQDNAWFAAVDQVISKNDRVTYDLGDGVKINIVKDVKDAQLFQNAMDRPVDFLKSLITDEKGNYNHKALFEFIFREVYREKILEEARKAGAAVKEESFLKKNKNSDVITETAGDANVKFNPADELAKGIRASMY